MNPITLIDRAVKKWNRAAAFRSISENLKCGRYTTSTARCLLCDTQSRTPVAMTDRYQLPAPLWLCETCGLVYQNPRLDSDSLKLFYAEEYRRLYRGTNRVTPDYIDRGLNRGKNIASYLTSQGITPGKNVLEMGCGPAGILKHFANLGHDVIGTEWDRECVAMGNQLGVRVIYGGLPELRALGKSFDLIILNHFVEHLEEPLNFLRDLKSLLSAEGVLYIEVPGIRDPERKEAFSDTLQLAHLTYFDRTTLSLLLQKAGYGVQTVDEVVHAIGRPYPLQSSGVSASANANVNRTLFQKDIERYGKRLIPA